jgi:NADH-quinone oxidoreductase subunit H
MFASDPLLVGDITGGDILIVLLKVVIIFVIGLVGTMLMVWFERKIIADLQNRIGPNKAGPFGVLQTLADGVKLIFKEGLIPDRADSVVFRLAPFLAFVPAFLVWAIIPLGGNFADGHDGVVELFGHKTYLQLADPPIGILFLLVLSSIAVYGMMLAGWSSGSKYPLLGSVRASAQMVSYEAAMGLSIASVLLLSGTLSTHGIALGQDTLGGWNIIATGLVPFIIFLIASTAEMNRPPFDLVEAEQELVSGFNTEYASFRFALFYLAEFMNAITMSAIVVTLFLGGPQPITIGSHTLTLPFGPLTGTVWFFLKLLALLYFQVWVRATLPRFRYDQLMNLGWKGMIPVAFGWFMLLAALRVARDVGWNQWVVGVIGIAVLGLCYLMLTAAIGASARNRAREGATF